MKYIDSTISSFCTMVVSTLDWCDIDQIENFGICFIGLKWLYSVFEIAWVIWQYFFSVRAMQILQNFSFYLNSCLIYIFLYLQTRVCISSYLTIEHSLILITLLGQNQLLMINCSCGMVDQWKALSLISRLDHCQRFSPLHHSHQIEFRLYCINYVVVKTTAPPRHKFVHIYSLNLEFLKFQKILKNKSVLQTIFGKVMHVPTYSKVLYYGRRQKTTQFSLVNDLKYCCRGIYF